MTLDGQIGTDTTPGLEVRPTSGHLGAEIHGVDLSQPLADATVAAIRAELLRWKVVFFRDQKIGPAEQIAFGRRFGDVTPAHPTLPAAIPELPEILVLDSPFGRLGVAVCYDLRFPELFRAMVDQGVEVIALPAAFTAITGRAHWETRSAVGTPLPVRYWYR